VRSPDPVIMGLSCTDDYNSALSPITLRDGELYTAAGRGGGGQGCFQNESELLTSHTLSLSLSHSHTHITNTFNTERVWRD
jgi:hypothetical protein